MLNYRSINLITIFLLLSSISFSQNAFQSAQADTSDYPYWIEMMQDEIRKAEHLVFVYPNWWGTYPALLKGFIDRVFSNGYAFEYGESGAKGLLEGKTAKLYICTGNPGEYYEQSGMYDAQRRINDAGVFGFCGIDTKITFFGNVTLGTDEQRKEYLQSIK